MRSRLWLDVCVLFSCFLSADFRRLRSVDNVNPLLNSVEFIWSVTTVAVGDTAVLHCSFDAIFQQLRSSNIDWFKEPSSGRAEFSTEAQSTKVASGKRVVIEDKRYRVYRPHNTALSVLIIRRSKKQDAGIYRCNLSGSTTRHKYMILNVTESKIEAQTSPAKMVAKVGTDVTLWCNATGYPKPVVYWTREDRNRTLPDGNQQFWGNELYFEKVTESDTGIYTCYLDNFVQPVVSYKFSLMVEDNPWYVDGSKMRFDSSHWYPQDSPDPKPARGKSYLLLCETRGSPKPLPHITWYRDGKPLRNNRHFYIIEDSPEWRPSYTSSTLVIMRFMTDFQGNYTCVASNAFRMKKQTFQLTTEQLPDEKTTTTTAAATVPPKGASSAVGGKAVLNNNVISVGDSKKAKSEEKTNMKTLEERKAQLGHSRSTIVTPSPKVGGKNARSKTQSPRGVAPNDDEDMTAGESGNGNTRNAYED